MAATLPLLVASCAGDPSFPSLAPRPIEDLSLAEPVLPPPSAGTPGNEAMAQYLPVIATARDADGIFRDTLATERGAIARGKGAATGTEAWLAAQVALSRVETARAPVAAALASLAAARDDEATRFDTGKARAVFEAYTIVQKIDLAEAAAVSTASISD